ncbi:MAG: hypothetical protein K0U12_02445 [Gammaproteobacteria bacterium]|nr:hypothetical protein [Gammaproteobacteria bacterium]
MHAQSKRNYALLILLAVVLIPQLFMPSIMAPDSPSYIAFSPQRPPLLPILLWLNRLLVGEHYYIFRALQIGLIFFAMHLMDKKLRPIFNIPRWAMTLLAVSFIIPPYIVFPYARYLLTEAIAIPLFVIFLTYLIEFIVTRAIKTTLILALLTMLLVLTRNQFLYLYGILFLAVIYLFFRRTNPQKILLIGLIFLLTIVLTTLLNRGYQYVVHGKFASNTSNGALLLVQPMFLAKPNDAKLFKDPKLKSLFNSLYQANTQAKFTLATLDPKPNYIRFLKDAAYFRSVFDPIQNQNFRKLNQLGYTSPYQQDIILKKLAITLLKHNWKQNLIFSIRKLILSLGDLVPFLVFCFLGLSLLIAQFIKPKNYIISAMLGLWILIFANNLTVSLAEMMLTRYLIYPYLCLLILMAALLFSRQNSLITKEKTL